MSFGENLKKLRKEKKHTQDDIAKLLNVSRPNVAQWEKGLYDPSLDAIKEIASFLNVSISELIDDSKKSVQSIPVIMTASCGNLDGNHLQVEAKTTYYVGNNWHQDLYAVVANGDSMSPEIDNSDEVICDPLEDVQSGDIVHYQIDGESSIKVYVLDEDARIIQFVPYNPTELFKTKTVRLDDEETIHQLRISKVIAVNRSKFNNRNARLKLIGRV